MGVERKCKAAGKIVKGKETKGVTVPRMGLRYTQVSLDKVVFPKSAAVVIDI